MEKNNLWKRAYSIAVLCIVISCFVSHTTATDSSTIVAPLIADSLMNSEFVSNNGISTSADPFRDSSELPSVGITLQDIAETVDSGIITKSQELQKLFSQIDPRTEVHVDPSDISQEDVVQLKRDGITKIVWPLDTAGVLKTELETSAQLTIQIASDTEMKLIVEGGSLALTVFFDALQAFPSSMADGNFPYVICGENLITTPVNVQNLATEASKEQVLIASDVAHGVEEIDKCTALLTRYPLIPIVFIEDITPNSELRIVDGTLPKHPSPEMMFNKSDRTAQPSSIGELTDGLNEESDWRSDPFCQMSAIADVYAACVKGSTPCAVFVGELGGPHRALGISIPVWTHARPDNCPVFREE